MIVKSFCIGVFGLEFVFTDFGIFADVSVRGNWFVPWTSWLFVYGSFIGKIS